MHWAERLKRQGFGIEAFPLLEKGHHHFLNDYFFFAPTFGGWYPMNSSL